VDLHNTGHDVQTCGALGQSLRRATPRWVVVYSDAARQRAQHTVRRQCLKASEADLQAFTALCQQAFVCPDRVESGAAGPVGGTGDNPALWLFSEVLSRVMRLPASVIAALLWALCLTAASAAEEASPAVLWTTLRSGGHIAIMRHAEAPGTGDPTGFRLDDCSTQRNLSTAGREQAQRIGQRFRDQGVKIARVLSSRWCRCLETARLLELGPVEPYPTLDSFFQQPERGPQQTADLRRFVSEVRNGPSLMLVTHQVNITALTGVFPQPGEIVVIRPDGNGGFTVLGWLGGG
jgi:phosphohistidine phosphatase SixA